MFEKHVKIKHFDAFEHAEWQVKTEFKQMQNPNWKR